MAATPAHQPPDPDKREAETRKWAISGHGEWELSTRHANAPKYLRKSGSNFQQHSIHAGTEVFKGGSVLAQTEELDDHAIVITEKARNRAGKPK